MHGKRSVRLRFWRFGRWLYRSVTRLVRPWRPVEEPAQLESPYPDYVTCPHCGELEVEVWSNEKTGCCHNCGRTFGYPPAPKNQAEDSQDT